MTTAKVGLLVLKAKIKGLAAEGRRTRTFIHRSTAMVRWGHWETKRQIGWEARNLLVAYGLMRGRPYSSIEPNCSCPPSADTLFKIIQQHSPGWVPAEKRWSIERVKEALLPPAKQEAA